MAPNQTVSNIANEFIDMQMKIMKLRDHNISSTVTDIIESGYISSEVKLYEFIKELFYVSRIRPKRTKTLSKFLVQFKAEETNQNSVISCIDDIIAEVIIDAEEEDRDYFYKKTSDFRFLRFLYDDGLISLDKIIEIYDLFPLGKKNQKALFALYFAPEFDQMSILLSFVSMNNNSLHPSIISVFSNLEEYKKDNWVELRHMYESGWEKGSIGDAIKEDNAELLQEYSLLPTFKLRQHFAINPFEPCALVQGHNMLDFACYYGSLKVFKFLLLLGIDFDIPCQCAVAGGNIEILRILLQKHAAMGSSLSVSVQYRRSNIMKWIFDFNYDFDSEFHSKEAFRNAIETNNVSAILHFIDLEFPSNVTDVISESTLHTAARAGNSTVFKMLSNMEGSDINGLDITGKTPLRVAVDHHRRHLVADNSDSGVEPNCHGSLMFTPLHLAVQQDDVQLVEALLKCKGIDVNFKNKFGSTPLSLAKSDKVRSVLIEAGAV